MNEISVSHLHGCNGVTEKIKKAMYEAAKEFVYIGFLLKEVRDYKYYEEGGYESVYDYAEFELGFKRSSTKNFIAIAETFGIQEYTYHGITTKTQSMSLQTEYEKFNYSQLVEMLAMSNTQRAQATPDMTVKELRHMKMRDRIEAIKNTPPPAFMLPAQTGQTSGQKINNQDNEENYIQVIRCKTCIFWKPFKSDVYSKGECSNYYGLTVNTSPKDYCSLAIKGENND